MNTIKLQRTDKNNPVCKCIHKSFKNHTVPCKKINKRVNRPEDNNRPATLFFNQFYHKLL